MKPGTRLMFPAKGGWVISGAISGRRRALQRRSSRCRAAGI